MISYRFIRIRHIVVSFLLVTSGPTFAQSEGAASEELIELSPFVVDRAQSASSLARTRIATALVDPSQSNTPPYVPVSIFKRAEAVAVQFVLSHSGDKQELRNRELFASVEAIEAEVKKATGLRLEQREVRFAGGDRKLFSTSKGNTAFSFASIVIFADLNADARIVDRVKQVRDIINSAKLAGQTKALDGSVGLYIKNPEQNRREILQKIFDDLEFVKKGLGAEFEVRPSGLNQRVQARISSESEIELWIDYSFTIHSIRELANPRK